MQCIVRTVLSHDVRLFVHHTMSVRPSVTHDVRLFVRHTRYPSVCPSHYVRPSHTMSICPSVTHDVRLSIRHTRCSSVRHSRCPSVTQCPSVCPSHTMSVCPSVTRRYCVKTAKRIIVLSSSGRHTILVVPHSTLWQYSDGDPLTGASNAGGMKKLRF